MQLPIALSSFPHTSSTVIIVYFLWCKTNSLTNVQFNSVKAIILRAFTQNPKPTFFSHHTGRLLCFSHTSLLPCQSSVYPYAIVNSFIPLVAHTLLLQPYRFIDQSDIDIFFNNFVAFLPSLSGSDPMDRSGQQSASGLNKIPRLKSHNNDDEDL